MEAEDLGSVAPTKLNSVIPYLVKSHLGLYLSDDHALVGSIFKDVGSNTPYGGGP